jgi:hypothetical protein
MTITTIDGQPYDAIQIGGQIYNIPIVGPVCAWPSPSRADAWRLANR